MRMKYLRWFQRKKKKLVWVSWYAKVVIIVVGYALSPIDLIPDFIPVLGYLDDLILVPIGVAFAIRLIPKDIMNECREKSKNIFKEGKPKIQIEGEIIIFIWIVIVDSSAKTK